MLTDGEVPEAQRKSGKPVWHCRLCDWWGINGPKAHYPANGVDYKHRPEDTYKAPFGGDLVFVVNPG